MPQALKYPDSTRKLMINPRDQHPAHSKSTKFFVFLCGLTAFLPFVGIGAATVFDLSIMLLSFNLIVNFNFSRVEKIVIFLVALSGAINVTFSHDVMASVFNFLQWIFLIFAIEKVAPLIGQKQLTETFWRGLQVSAILASLIVAADLFSGNITRIGGRYVFIYTSPQPLAFLFLIVSLINFTSLVTAFRLSVGFKGFVGFMAFLGATGLSLAVVAASASRTGLLGLAVGVTLILGFKLFRRGVSTGRVTIWGILMVLLTFSGILLFGVALIDAAVNTDISMKVVERFSGTLAGQSNLVDGRINILQFFLQNFSFGDLLVGTGLDAYTAEYSEAKKPHNVFVLLLAEGGIMFWAIGVFFIVRWLIMPIRLLSRRSQRRKDIFVAGILAMALAVLIIMLFNTAVIQRHLWVGIMLSFALLHQQGYFRPRRPVRYMPLEPKRIPA
jgi:hypothetical protein